MKQILTILYFFGSTILLSSHGLLNTLGFTVVFINFLYSAIVFNRLLHGNTKRQ